jgi:short-subunit dehydrogenase|tara:strand:- start:739 stop:969 length:231 start_codon:yes stop_codon:yes gene_type:complete
MVGTWFATILLQKRKTKELKCKIDKFSVGSLFLKADFLIEKQLLSFVDKISELKIDSLVNNVGTYTVKKHFSKLSL